MDFKKTVSVIKNKNKRGCLKEEAAFLFSVSNGSAYYLQDA